MQGFDLPHILFPLVPADQADHTAPARTEPTEERPLSAWPLHTPPLRYDVASLEHWLDLNA